MFGGILVLLVIINLKFLKTLAVSDNSFLISLVSEDGTAAKVVAEYSLIDEKISSGLTIFLCKTRVLPTEIEVCKHPKPNECESGSGRTSTSEL
tara:strand:+ start:382 stop:663 length:282 start_codon:yes stop_codon:yes gene_type:complete